VSSAISSEQRHATGADRFKLESPIAAKQSTAALWAPTGKGISTYAAVGQSNILIALNARDGFDERSQGRPGDARRRW